MALTSIFGWEYDTTKVVSSLPRDLREIDSWQIWSEFIVYKGEVIGADRFEFYKLLLLASLMNFDWLKNLIQSKLNIQLWWKNKKFSIFNKTPENVSADAQAIDDRKVHVTELWVSIFDGLSQDVDFLKQLNDFIKNPVYSSDWDFMLPTKKDDYYRESTTSMADFPHRVHVALNTYLL